MSQKIKKPKIISSDYRLKKFLSIIIFLLGAVALWQSYLLGQEHASVRLIEQESIIANLISREEGISQELEKLKSKYVLVEKSKKISEAAILKVREELISLQNSQLELRKQIEFYKSLASGSINSLRAVKINIDKLAKKEAYRYSFQISKRSKSKKVVTGKIKIKVSGIQGNKKSILDHKKLGINKISENIRFKHFQTFRGEFKIPINFAPKIFHIEMIPDGNLFEISEESFPWKIGNL